MGTQSLITTRLAQIGSQRDWVWRGWQIRYTYIRPALDSTGKQTGLPVIFLHGFGSALGQWRSNLKPLGEQHHIYALDFLGFGASEKAADRYSVWLWADLVYDFWRTFIGKPAVVVGHSLGALIGLTAVANHPEMACGLVLLTLPDAQPKQPPAWARSVERIFANHLLLLPLFEIVRQPWLLRRVLQTIYIRQELVDEELVALFATPPQDRGALAVFCRLSQSRSDDNYSPTVKDLLPCVRTPILLLWGREDRVVPFAGAGQFKQINPNVRLVDIENAGHCAFDEYPEKVNQEIIDWIDKEVRASVSLAAG